MLLMTFLSSCALQGKVTFLGKASPSFQEASSVLREELAIANLLFNMLSGDNKS